MLRVRRVIFVLFGVGVRLLVILVVCAMASAIDGSSSKVMFGNASDAVRVVELGYELLALSVRG